MRADQKGRRPHRRRSRVLVLTAVGAIVGGLSLAPSHPALIWNATESVPVGLYAISQEAPKRGDIVALAPAGDLRDTLDAYSVLPDGRLLLKQLAALTADKVCRRDDLVTINGATAAIARLATREGRTLPAWNGCRLLDAREILVLAPHPSSFDSRYFGPVDKDLVVGVARPLLTLPLSQEAR